MEDGVVAATTAGTPPGAVASPLLANVYLHYVFDRWAQRWRKRHAQGDIIIVRYADDIVVGFEHEAEARRFLADLRRRLEEFALSLHPDKTRLIEFARHAAVNRRRRGVGKAETFTFLGFTHICGRSRRAHQPQRLGRIPLPRHGGSGCARSGGAASGTARPGNGALVSPIAGSRNRASFTPGRINAWPSNTRGGSPVPESGTPGSVRGARGNSCPYRDRAVRVRLSLRADLTEPFPKRPESGD